MAARAPKSKPEAAVRSSGPTRKTARGRATVSPAPETTSDALGPLAFASLPALLVSASDKTVLSANQAFLAMTGLNAESCLGQPAADLSLWKDPEALERALSSAAKGRRVENAELAVNNGKEGGKKVLLSANLLPDGGSPQVLCSLIDVSGLSQALRERDVDLEVKARELTETNEALRLLLSQNREDGKRLEQRIVANVEDLVLPYLQRMKETPLDMDQRVYLSVVESNLTELISPFMRQLGNRHANLTPREIEVANLVRMGTTSKEIARLLKISKRAVEFHRDSLRNKLGLKKTKQNLRAYLSSLS